MNFWKRILGSAAKSSSDTKIQHSSAPPGRWQLAIQDGGFGTIKDDSAVVRGIWFKEKGMASTPLVVGKLVAIWIENGVKFDEGDLAAFQAAGFGGMTIDSAEGGYCVWFPSAARLG